MNKLKKIILTLLLLELFISYTPVSAQVTPYNYATEAGVEAQIRKYLCAPTPVDPSQTNITNGALNSQSNFQQQAAFNNTNSGDLYRCINQMYKFAIILAGVVGVFFIVIAGYVYMSAEGNDEAVTKAKDILVSTISSMVILMAGYILLRAINPDLVRFNSVQPPSVVGLKPATTPSTPSYSPYTPGTGASTYVLAGYNIGRYATAKEHELTVTRVFNSISTKDLSTAQKITDYMRQRSLNGRITPLTGEMVLSSANKYNVDFRVILAIMEVDSHYGTDGDRAILNKNPGNVGNVDSGQNRSFPSWQAGVDAVAEWLNKNRA